MEDKARISPLKAIERREEMGNPFAQVKRPDEAHGKRVRIGSDRMKVVEIDAGRDVDNLISREARPQECVPYQR
jgi:hypothetical protein